MTRPSAVREIVCAFDAVAQEFGGTADDFEGVKHRCREALAAFGVTDDEIEGSMTAAPCTAG